MNFVRPRETAVQCRRTVRCHEPTRPAEFEPDAPAIGSWKTPEHAVDESLDSAPVEPACETGAILTITDYDVRSLYLDLLRRNLTRYGMHERMPAEWPLRRRLLFKTVNALSARRNGASRSISANASWAWTGRRRPRR